MPVFGRRGDPRRDERTRRRWQGSEHVVGIWLGLLLSVASLFATTNDPAFEPTLPDTTRWPEGRYVYQGNCLVCHGAYGDGRGEMGRQLKPQPRNFGRDLFRTACAACHGTDGSGRGATAKDLEDSWGQPATPSDLRQAALRTGRTLEAVYRVLLTRIETTPIPSFTKAMTEEQRWELVAFIAQLRRDQAAGSTRAELRTHTRLSNQVSPN